MKKINRNQRKNLKVIIPLIIVAILIFGLFWGYKILTRKKIASFLENVQVGTYANINKYVIYGTHMNITGNIAIGENVNDIKLILKSAQEEKDLKATFEKGDSSYSFYLSDYINDGLYLENIPNDTYYLLIKTKDEENGDKYYSVLNDTDYDNLTYYTLTKNAKNNKIEIEWNTYEELPTLRFEITETILPDDVYDFTIDPGHDASDPGMTICFKNNIITNPYGDYCPYNMTLYKESDFNLEVSLALKDKLTALGYKVSMTRKTKNDLVNIYETMGSATMANDTSSKYNIAIHHNSTGAGGNQTSAKGIEVYIANDTKLSLATSIVDSLIKDANASPSYKYTNKVEDGIYQRLFTEEEILEDDVQPSNKTTDTPYYYNLREVGGISTHASNDGRYENIGPYYYPKNPYYNANKTAESYLIELGYLDNLEDLQNILNNKDGYANGIANGFKNYLEKEAA